jgi:DNA repair exonuclease SbcCD ATPase subunit/DNA repair exonuclease SbcCD nuclease subunit
MLRIAHTADIHIRSLSRHDEYREVFTAFIKDCKKNKVDHIFIGGDIFHTKTTGISPEYIDFLTWWLEAMAEVAPVHLTLGNHDGNLVNLSRQDAVSPIVAALNNPRVTLYKKSGTYEFHPGYAWCVYSLFDEEGWKDVKPIPGKVNIACYHGPVRGSTTETGWELDEGLTTEFFNDYPFVLLGDIHKRQFLGYRNEKPWIGYPGTPLQQNYAEELDHGYLLWDIEDETSWDVNFHKLPNPKPYVTLIWNGNQKDVLKSAREYPKQARFRIKSSIAMNQDDIHLLTETLKTSFSATEVTFKSEHKIESGTIKAGTATLEKSNLRSPDVVLSLLQSFCKENNTFEIDWDITSLQVKKYLSTVVSSDEMTRGSKWSLRHLKWDNTFAYGEDNEIDFSKLNGIVGIFGPNRTGKSSIVGTMMYSLFNTTDRGSIKNLYVCNVRKPYCSSRAVVEYNGKVYVIERQTTKSANKKGIVSAATALNLYGMREDGEFDDLCGEQRSDTEKSVRTLVGVSEDFLMTSLSAQGETNAFISQGSTKRRALLTRFLDLDIFDKMFELSNKDLNVYKAQLKNFPDRNWDELQSQNQKTVKILCEKLSDFKLKMSDGQLQMSDFRSQLSLHKDLKAVTAGDVDDQEQKVKSLIFATQNCTAKIATLNEEISVLKDKLKTVEEIETLDDIDDLKKKLSAIDVLEKSIVELQHLHEVESVTLKSQQKSLKILDEVPCGDDYPSCKFIKDAYANKEIVGLQQEKASVIFNKLKKAQDSLSSVGKDSILSRVSRLEKASSLSSKFKLEISRKETEIEKIRTSCEYSISSLSSAQEKLNDLQEALKNEDNLEVVSIRSKIESLSRQIREWDDEKLSIATQHGRLLAEIEKLDAEKASRDSILQNMKTFEAVSNAFSKKGIPLIITRSQLPFINSEIAKILQGIVDFSIELENDEDSDATEIYINYGDSRRIIELCSGMEKTIASIAIRVALANVSSLTKSDMFIIDEGFGTLDDAGVEACSRLLTSLKKIFRIVLVITHVDGIKDAADHILEITKNEKDSRIVFA